MAKNIHPNSNADLFKSDIASKKMASCSHVPNDSINICSKNPDFPTFHSLKDCKELESICLMMEDV